MQVFWHIAPGFSVRINKLKVYCVFTAKATLYQASKKQKKLKISVLGI